MISTDHFSFCFKLLLSSVVAKTSKHKLKIKINDRSKLNPRIIIQNELQPVLHHVIDLRQFCTCKIQEYSRYFHLAQQKDAFVFYGITQLSCSLVTDVAGDVSVS